MKKTLLTFLLAVLSLCSYSQLAWLRLPDYPGLGKPGVSSFSINGKGYMGLGLDTLVHGTADWYEYDPVANVWTQKASLPTAPRYACANFVINGKGYIATGSSTILLKEVWEYDPVANSWLQKANFPGNARETAAGFAIGNKGYVGTGYASGNSFTDFYEFDPAANTWTAKAPYGGTARNTAAAFSIGSKGYIGMGNATNSVSNYNDLFEYDTTANAWTQKADFPITYIDCPTTYSTATDGYVLCGYYYQATGITHNPLNTLYKYDPVANEWSLVGTFRGLPRGYAGGFSISNDMYIGCGSQSNDGDAALMLHDFWKLSNGMLLSAENPTGGTDVSLYPNPATSTIFISGDLTGKKIVMMRLYDAAGRLLRTSAIKNNTDAVDVSSLRNGLYFVEFITKENEVLDSRFVKQ